ncbi:hypothetical protein J1C47_12440 [Jiella sp. MQZ13P-4]|uniref:Cell envelope integrity protein TolA n=2 Tax=Jiella sonneratiae TaxID=2816856 RepID=A0ABS3J5M9_9HYPH|nr:hypothetical protein [Jiella sonneratiae]MBO0904450.1 hypothetical protein [Jiella sonneratiae]
MRAGVVVSAVLHAVVLTWGLWSLGAPDPLEVASVDSLPVDLVPVEEYSQSLIGKKDAPVTETPAPDPTEKPVVDDSAQNAGDNSTDLETPPTPTERERAVEQTAAPKASEPPPPSSKPAEETPPVPEAVPTPRPEPTPQPQETKTAEEPAPAEPAPQEADPIEEAIATAETQPQQQPEKKPEQKPAEPEVAALPERGPVPQLRPSRPQPTETKKPEKPAEKPSKPAQDDSQFDADKIAALLNKEKSAGGGARRSQQQASLGGDRKTGGKLSQSELDALRGQVSQCWSPPAGVSEAGALRVTIRMRLDPSGGLEGRPELVEGGGGSTVERAAADAALRAVIRCAPYKLPAEKYDTWSEVLLNFDPSQML